VRYLSVASGIEAASVAWHPLGWEAAAFAEIDPFPCAVLSERWPSVPNLGDMTKYREWKIDAPIDILVGGTPCQSFSVAGLRGGLDDPRGNLMLVYLAIARAFRPDWIVWENVPGVLSSNRGRDFGSFFGGLAELGYGFAYRVLDAQYFGVPQRRRRVFVVGYIGDWRVAAAVLFERESVRGNPPPSRETGERVASTITRGAESSGKGGYSGRRQEDDINIVTVPALTQSGRGVERIGESRGQNPVIVVNAEGDAGLPFLTRSNIGKGVNNQTPLIAHALRGEGFDAREDGTGRGTPIVVQNVETMYSVRHGKKTETDPVEKLRALWRYVDEETLSEWCIGIIAAFWPKEVLRSEMYGGRFRLATKPKRGLVNIALSRSEDGSKWTVLDLWEAGCDGCAPQRWRPHEQLAAELGSYLSELPYSPSPAERFMRDMWEAGEGSRLLRQTLSTIQEVRRSESIQAEPTQSHRVRRLVPEEAEALQGFPRGYTLITYRGKPAADGPRYKSLGNSMAVPVMSWIGRRIEKVNCILRGK